MLLQLCMNKDLTPLPWSLCPVVALLTKSGSCFALIRNASLWAPFVHSALGFRMCTVNVHSFGLTLKTLG